MTEYFKSDDQIRSLVASFEAYTIHPSDFRHYQHLTVALWYVLSLPYDQAAAKMTSGIRRLAEAYGKSGYHETITLVWLRVVSEFASNREDSLLATANQLIEKYNDKNFIRRYYSHEVIESEKAKAEWVEPDLQPLPPGFRSSKPI